MRSHLVILALLLSITFGRVSAADKEPTLTADDKKYLDGLMKEFLFDPAGAQRVAVAVEVRTVWGGDSFEIEAEGWFVPPKNGKSSRIASTDGASIPIPTENKKWHKANYLDACRSRYSAAQKDAGPKKIGPDLNKLIRERDRIAFGLVTDDDVAHAAWLYRLGQDGLAAKALAVARKTDADPRKRIREQLAWSAFAGMVHAYMVRADAESLAHGERLLRLYAEEARGNEYSQATAIVADLRRRQKNGSFGKIPSEKWPDDFAKWDAKKKAAYLIDALDQVDSRPWELASDRRVAELIRLGDAAIPDLIDVIEKDDRLTRSVFFVRDFLPSRTVLSVGDAALTSITWILRSQLFQHHAANTFTPLTGAAAKETATRLRDYWKKYGSQPLDERMMTILTDPKVDFQMKREAAENLVHWDEGANPDKKLDNPALAKFKNPTAADAILTAMDADLKAYDAKPLSDQNTDQRQTLENNYLLNIKDLGDKRMAPEMARRSLAAKSVRHRRQWAYAAHVLGDPEPFEKFADDFRLGKIVLPANDRPKTSNAEQPGTLELAECVHNLILAATPAADRALAALDDAKHPQHDAVARQIMATRDQPWFSHPFCLRILRAALDNTVLSGAIYQIEKGRLIRKELLGSTASEGVPDLLADPAQRNESAEERICDSAALKLSELVIGLPRYHPLLKDADKRLAAIKIVLDRYINNYRVATWPEIAVVGNSSSARFIPNIRPLNRAATSYDVVTGKAIFDLDNSGKPADMKLPTTAVLKRDAKIRSPRVLIVQAETDATGNMFYGIITADHLRMVPARELVGIKSFAELEKEEKEKK